MAASKSAGDESFRFLTTSIDSGILSDGEIPERYITLLTSASGLTDILDLFIIPPATP